MKVTYHGEYPEGQADDDGDQFIVQHGYTFTRGKSVDVKEEALQAKFAGNRFFKTDKSDKDEVDAAKDEAEEAEVQTLRDWLDDHQVAYHHKLGAPKLRQLKEDWLSAKAAAEES